MMKLLLTIGLGLLMSASSLLAQEEVSLESLKSMLAEKSAAQADLQGQADALAGEVAGLKAQIDKLSGWRKAGSGILGFNFNEATKWLGAPNTSASGLAINLNGELLNDKDKTFWHNRGVAKLAYQDTDTSEGDAEAEDDGLFDNNTVDLVNISSLGGYKISDKLAISGQGDLLTTFKSQFQTGTFDIGAGVTWLPIDNMTVMIHPLNYNLAFSKDGFDGTLASMGAKIRADYSRSFDVAGKKVNWVSGLNTFLPYKKPELDGVEQDVTYYQWMNDITFEVWKGIGVGLGLGLRKNELESTDTQTIYNVGLSYTL